MTSRPIAQTAALWRLVAEARAGYVCMHMQGTPQTMQANPAYTDVVREVREFFSERLQRLSDCGVSRDQIILDPGIGFGKTVEHNLQLLGAARSFARLGAPRAAGCFAQVLYREIAGRGTRGAAAGGAGVRLPGGGRRGADHPRP